MLRGLWNAMTMEQKKMAQDALRWGTLGGATVAIYYGGLHTEVLPAVLGWAYALLFWGVQFFRKGGVKE